MSVIKQHPDLRLYQPTTAFTAGQLHVFRRSYTFTANVDASEDIFELAVLPANHRIHGFRLAAANLGATETVAIGFMSGDPFSKSSARTCDTAILGASNPTSVYELGVVALATLAANVAAVNRSIGMKIGIDINDIAGNEVVHFEMLYAPTD